MFKLFSATNNGAFIDYEMVDSSPKSRRRLWRLTHDIENDSWYATLSRSDTDFGEFKGCVVVPAKLRHAMQSQDLSAVS